MTDCWDSEDRAGSGDITRDDAIMCMSNSTAMIFKFHHHSDLNFYSSEKPTEPSGGFIFPLIGGRVRFIQICVSANVHPSTLHADRNGACPHFIRDVCHSHWA